MRRIDTDQGETFWKIALVGPGGTGKTGMGVSAPRPLILLSERQGLVHIKQAARRLGVPVPPVVLIEEAQDYREALKALHAPRDKPFKIPGVMELPVEEWPLTVVIDSLTDACDVLIAEIRKKSPQKDGRDGLPVDAQRFWGVLIDRANGIIKGFRDLPMNVVYLCLLSDKTKEDRDGKILERILQPKLATKDMAQSLSAAVNVMGYTYRTIDKRKRPSWGVMTIGPEGMLTKPCEPLLQFEVPDLSSWIARLNGEIMDVVPPLVPESMEIPEGEDDDVGEEPPPNIGFAKRPPTFQCSHCDTEVAEDGGICAAHEAELDAAEEALKGQIHVPEPPTEPETTAEPDPDPPPAEPPTEPEAPGAVGVLEADGPNPVAPAEPEKAAAPAMVPCKHCGRRLGTKGYAEGKRRACDESAGDCEPTL